MKRSEASRQLKDPAALTPYEQKMWELHQTGMTYKKIAEHTNQKMFSVTSRFKIIRQKKELENAR